MASRSSLLHQVSRSSQPIILADFMRVLPSLAAPQNSMQNIIARVLAEWVEPAFDEIFDAGVKCCVWDRNDIHEAKNGILNMPVPAIYESMGRDLSFQSWLNLYNATPSKDVLELLKPHLQGSFVLGFEISPFLGRALDALDIPYVSVAIHPIRFMPDYYFSMTSNCVELDRLNSYAEANSELVFGAQLRRAEMRRKITLDLDRNSAIIFGQTEYDSSLIEDDHLIGLHHFTDDIQDIFRTHETVYFKPHPYAHHTQTQTKFMLQFGNVKLISEDAYALLSCPNIDTVAAQTSGILTEARFFGKEPRAFWPRWRSLADEPAFSVRALSADFWKEALNSDRKQAHEEHVPAFTGETPGSLKSLLGISWSDFGLDGMTSHTKPLPYNTTLSFGTDNNVKKMLLGDTWLAVERDHCWARPGENKFILKVPAGTESAFRLSVTFHAMATPENPLRADFMLGDVIAHREFCDGLGERFAEFRIDRKHVSAFGDIPVNLVIEGGCSPNMIDAANADRRLLTIAINSICLKPVEDALPVCQGMHVSTDTLTLDSPLLVDGWTKLGTAIGLQEGKAAICFNYARAPDTDQELVLHLDSTSQSESISPTSLKICVYGQPVEHRQLDTQIIVPVPRSLLADAKPISIEFETPLSFPNESDHQSPSLLIRQFQFRSAVSPLATAKNAHVSAVIGPVNSEIGLSVMTRNVFRAIQEAHSFVETSDGLLGPRAINFNNSEHTETDCGLVDPSATASDVNIFCGDVTRIQRLVQGIGTNFLKNRHNICYGAWELAELPAHLADSAYIEEFWGLSTFIADAAQRKMNIPVRAMPLPVSPIYPKELRTRESFGISREAFAFLFTFSVDSTLTRKNPDAIFRAFQTAFPSRDDNVCLILKSMMKQAQPHVRVAFEEFKRRVSDDDRIILIEETLSADDNASLYLNADAYVSLHRAEGFGLTLAEAMGYGKPTIGTRYSGNLDFMTEVNSCLVDYQLIDMATDDYHQQRQQWADADSEHAAYYMRRLFGDPLYRETVARAGKQTILRDFSCLTVGRKILGRLNQIRKDMA